MPKFSVSITGVDVAVEAELYEPEVLRDLAMTALKEAYVLERETMARVARGNMPAVGFQGEKSTDRPVKPGMITMSPEIRYE